MARFLINHHLQNCVIVLGPKEPPIDYYHNLISIVGNRSPNHPANELLDFDLRETAWCPEEINSNGSQVDKIVASLDSSVS